jgi:transposase
MSHVNRSSTEARERAVRLVRDHTKNHTSQWAAIQSSAGKLGCTAESLRRWVREDERKAGERPGVNAEERERSKALETRNGELRRAKEMRRKASVDSRSQRHRVSN